jgi:predicted TIM-barrel fold metal-dependent hydrolase
MYAVDYPYESTTEANEWFESVDLDPAAKRSIGYLNAVRVLKLPQPEPAGFVR